MNDNYGFKPTKQMGCYRMMNNQIEKNAKHAHLYIYED